MTTVFYDPDEQHRFKDIEAESCAGLEALIGADFLISKLPIDPVKAPQWHVENRSVPVNLKVGYDSVVNFEQRHKFAARTQALGFKMNFLLGVGTYRNKDGQLQISGYRASEKIPYSTFQQMKFNEAARGVRWDSIENLDELPGWIDGISKMMELPEKQTVLPKSQYSAYEWYGGDDPWQLMEEISAESVARIAACGLPDFGPKRVQAVIDYLIQNKYPVCMYTFWAVLTQIDEKQKRVHKIKGIGPELWKRSRDWLFRDQTINSEQDINLLTEMNLCIHTVRDRQEFHRGAKSGIQRLTQFFEAELKAGRNGKQAYNTAIELADKFVDEFYLARQLPGDEIPF